VDGFEDVTRESGKEYVSGTGSNLKEREGKAGLA